MPAPDPSDTSRAEPFEPDACALWPVLEQVRQAVVLVDGGQRVSAANLAAASLLGHDPGWLTGKPVELLFAPSSRQTHRQLVADFIASGPHHPAAGPCGPVRALRADGAELDVQVQLAPIGLPATPPGGNGHAELLTDLRGDRPPVAGPAPFSRQVQSVFELLPVPVTITDDDQVVFANLAAQRLFQRGHSLVGQSFCALLDEPSRAAVRESMSRCAAGDPDCAAIHGRLRNPDGTVREVDITVAVLPDHGHATMQLVLADVTGHRHQARELRRSGESLRRLSASVVEAREQERRRIAHELHDELGQQLSALKMALSSLSGDAASATAIERMLALLNDAIASVRRISSDLRPMMLDDLGLNAAIEWLARDATRRLGFVIDLDLDETLPPADERLATSIYRIVQEGLTNVARHARATRVAIRLRQDRGRLVLVIADDGIGYPPDAMHRPGSYGLLGIHERVGMLGGTLKLDNPPAGGGQLTLRIPLAGPRQARSPGSPA